MTKAEFIYLVQTKLGGGHATAEIRAKYRDAIVDAYIGQVFNDYVVKVWQNSTTPNKSDLDAYTKIYGELNIQSGGVGTYNKKYIAIPTGKLLQIPNNQAIRAIFTVETTPRRCLPRETYADNVFSQLEVNTYITDVRFEVIGERIYLYNSLALTQLNLHMIVPWSEFISTEKVPIPFENDGNAMDLIIQRILSAPMQDKIIDANVVQQ